MAKAPVLTPQAEDFPRWYQDVLAKAELAGMAQVFEHVAVISDPAMLKGRRYGNIILLGSDTPLPAEGSAEAAALAKPLLAGAVPAQYKDERWTREFFSGANALVDED